MPTITIPDSEQIALGRNGAIGTLTIEWSRVPQHVVDHIWRVYSVQYITDAANAGGKDATPEERFALAQKKLDNMYKGAIRASTTRTPADPVAAEADKLARAALATAFRDKGWWKVIGKTEGESNLECVIRNRLAFLKKPNTPDDVQSFIDAHANAELIQAEAKRNVADRAKRAKSVNLDDLAG